MITETFPRRAPARRSRALALLLSACAGVAALLGSDTTLAEGSRNLYPAGAEAIADAGRGNLDVSQPNDFYLNAVRRRGFIYVYAQAGERILVGSRNRTAAGVGIIQVYNPQSFGTRGAETLPGTASFTCTTGTTGLIADRTQELAGPRAVTGGGNPTGYVPCAYTAPVTGLYGVNFTGGNAGGGPDANIATPAVSDSTVSAWDVTVRSSDASTTDINGRVFTFAWTVFTAGNGTGRRLNQDLYYVSLDGYRYRQRLTGIDPNGGTFFANTLGFLDTGEPLYKNIRATNPLVSTGIAAGLSVQTAQFPIFLSNIAPTAGNAAINTEVERVLVALGIPTTPLPPQVNSFQFTYPPTGGSTAYVGQGGTFSFTVTDTISFEIVVSRDGVNFDPALPANRVLTGQSGTGAYSIQWDGRDNAGTPFPPGNGYRFRMSGRNGEAHFPFADVEGNFNGGPILTKLNGNIQDALVYYDDRGYITRGGTAVGALNGHICGAASPLEQSSPNVNLVGADSANANFGGSGNYYRRWANAANRNADCDTGGAPANLQGFGDAKGLNLWTYQATLPQSSILDIIDFADVIATVQAPASADPGGSVLVNIGFGNVGSQNAANVTYSIQLPPGLTGVSCGGASCSYDPATGLVTVTGLPSSLSPGQNQPVTLSYTAPPSGAVTVVATIGTSTNQGPNLAPDSASAVTVVGGNNDADVLTQLQAPATAVAGAQVAVDVAFANVGGTTAAGLVYALQLPTGLTGVSCTAGVTCTYNPATGAVSVTGLPGSLLPGGTTPPFQLLYTAPASGSVVVESNISTTSPEANLANNTASGVTTILGGQPVDVATSVQAPATATPGSTVTAQVNFQNVGSNAVSGTGYSLQLPPGLTGVSCVAPVICTYDPATGAVSVSGLSGDLAPGEFASLSIRYTAPNSGVVTVEATATLAGDVNLSNNTAEASTTVITAGTGVDVTTTVNAPATAAPGATVNVPVSYSNLGPDTAAGLGYGLSLPPGLTGVSCSGSGVTCTYNSTTGVVTVNGAPASLAAGDSIGFTLSYTAPGSGTVDVESTISTTTAESNLANNTAQGSTLIQGATTADVTTSVSAPATAPVNSLVQVQVGFGNVGAITASTIGYQIVVGAGASAVEVRFNGVLCSYNAGTGAVTGCGLPASLTPGQQLQLDVSYTAPAVPGSVQVTSTITTSTPQSNTNNDTANATTLILGDIELTVVKTASAASFTVGLPASYTLQVTNSGSTATTAAASVTDAVPASLTLGTLPAGCTAAGQNVTCTIAAGLAPSASVSFVIPVTPTAAALPSVSNTANVSGGGDPGCPGQPRCTSTINTPVGRTSDLSLSKSATPDPVAVGSNLLFTLTISNAGASGILASDTFAINESLPAGLTGCSYTPSAGTFTVGTIAPGASGTGTWSGVAIPSGGSASLGIFCSVSASAGASLTNTATVIPPTGVTDPDCSGAPVSCAGGNTDDVTVGVIRPQLSLTKTASSASFTVGVLASYTLQVTNTGTAATTAVATISDAVPAGLTLGTLPAGCTAAGQNVTCTIAAGLAAGSSTSFVIPVTPTAAAQPSVTNTASVNGGGDPTCPAAARCSDTEITPVNAPELTITKTASAASFVVGTPASYTLQVTNTGTAATTATATVTDTVPASLTLGTMPANCSAAGQTVTCTIAVGLAPAANVSFVIPVTPTAAAQPSVTNTASVSGGGDPTCPAAARCSDTEITPVDAPQLSLTKTASAASFVVGTPASYTLQVTNSGTVATTAVATVTDVVPASLTLGTMPANCSAAGQTVTCTIAVGLAPSASVSFVIPVTPTAAALPSVTNSASVSGGGDPTCPAAARCSDTEITPVEAPELTITKTASAASFVVGTPASYTLQVTNSGAVATTAVATVTDVVPASLTLGTMPANCSAAGQTVTCTIIAGLAPAGSVSFVIPVTPTAAALPSVTNTASVSGGGDPGCPAAVRCSDTEITPVDAPALTITKTASAGFTVGVAASYTLQVTNTGTVATTAVATVTDVVPASLTLGVMPANCAAAGQTVTCTIAAGFAPSASVSFVIPVTPTAAAQPSVSNTASVSGGGDPGCPAAVRCSDTEITPVDSPELSITKTASAASFVVGTPASYTLQVTNSGTVATNAVATVTDAVPASLTLGVMPANCAAAGQTVTCTIASGLAPSASVSFVIPVTPTAAAQPSVSNTASVSGGGDPGCPAAVRCSDTEITPVDAPELTITKTASAGFTVGVAASYTLQVTNTGTAATTAVATVTDAVPTSLTLGAMPANCAAAGQTVTCTIAAGLAPSASVSFVIPVTPTAAAQPSVTNTASVGGGGDPGCPAAVRCSDTEITPVNSPELSITKTASSASFVVGVAASYTLQVTNSGSVATTAVATVTDAVPASLTLGAMPANCSAAGQTVTCTIAVGLAPAANVSFVIPVTPTAAALPSVTNTASVGGGGDPGCPAAARCGSTVITPVVGPTVQVSKSATPTSGTRVNPGDSIAYSVQVQISGAALTAPFELTDTLDAQLTLGAVTNGAFTCNAASPLICSLPAGTPVGSYSLAYLATVAATANGTVSNAVVISANGGDPNPTCTPCTTLHPLALADLEVIKTVDQTRPAYGATINFTLLVRNNGPDAATGVQVADALPSGFTLLGTSASQGSYTAPVWDVGSLAVGATATLQMQVRVNSGGSYRNSATVIADQFDPIIENNDDDVTPSPLGLQRAAVIPVDAPWALLALMGLLLGIAGLQLRRRG